MSRHPLILAPLFVCAVVPIAALAATVSWPETVDLLVEEQSKARTCVDLLKGSGDKAAIMQGRIAYGVAKAAADGVIAGFTIALVEGGKPENLPRIQANLEKSGQGLQEVCDVAVKAASAAGGTKGIVDELAKTALSPVIDGLKSAASTLWTRLARFRPRPMSR